MFTLDNLLMTIKHQKLIHKPHTGTQKAKSNRLISNQCMYLFKKNHLFQLAHNMPSKGG